MTYELSILIPARNEAFLKHTIDDILANRRAKTEIIVVLDGSWPVEPIPDHPDVTLIYHPEAIGQRAACNEAARVSTAKYVCKVDAHCSFDEGFDVKLMADMQDDWTMVPIMRNLHVYNVVCIKCSTKYYQGYDKPCQVCGGVSFEHELVWRAKPSPQSKSYCFDSTPHFAYFGDYSKRPEGQGDLTETMSLQGSCFLMTRDKYFELGINDETFGSWGSQGIEVACKTWLSGGKVIVSHKTFYAHMFRSGGGNLSFPYSLPRSQQEHAQAAVRDLFFNNKWEQQIHPLSWLVEKFWPVRGWRDEDLRAIQEKGIEFNERKISTSESQHVLREAQEGIHQRRDNSDTVHDWSNISPRAGVSHSLDTNPDNSIARGIVFYTDSQLSPTIARACQQQISQSINGHELISVSLQPLAFGRNLVLEKEPGYLTLFQQILAGLEASTADIIFLAEHDCFYTPEHFQFNPPDPTKIYYNQNVWQVRTSDGFAVSYEAKRLSQLVAYRDVLIEHYRKRVEKTRAKLDEFGDNTEYRRFIRQQGFEVGTHNRNERVDNLQSEYFVSSVPNLDLKHGQNLTPARWSPEQFRDKRNCKGWTESDTIPGWGSARALVTKITGVIDHE